MDVCLLCVYVVLSCVGRGLCDGLITGAEETSKRGGQGSNMGCSATGKKNAAWRAVIEKCIHDP
jgi:hypothetical protein